jgi:hypothetical protein
VNQTVKPEDISMFDNLREEASSSLYEDRAKFIPAAGTTSDPAMRKANRFLGMTPIQRFIIALLLMIAVCSLGAMCLLVTGRVGLF